jgi:two-component system response regulator AtoC
VFVTQPDPVDQASMTRAQLLAFARDLATAIDRERKHNRELALVRKQLAVLGEFGLKLFQCNSSSQMLRMAADTVSQRLGLAGVAVLLDHVDEGLVEQTIEGAVSLGDTWPGVIPPSHLVYQRIVRGGTPYLTGPTTRDSLLGLFPRYIESGQHPDATAAVSLFGRNQIVGAMIISSRDRRKPITGEQLWMMTIVGGQLGTAVGNARQMEIERRERERLDALAKEQTRQLKERCQFHKIIGRSAPMQRVYSFLDRLCEFDTTVMITGETGTGKELVAQAIHYNGVRAKGPFLVVNCAAIPEPLLESELFGHVKGAFTGAVKDRVGKVELAEEGTLFLDEIAEMPLTLQAKLLRLLQERQFERVGENHLRHANVRIISATNVDPDDAVAKNKLRMDLLYRLNVVNVCLPPLRERGDDVLLLAEHFVDQLNRSLGCDVQGMTPEAANLLLAYDWPGNVRQLRNVIERAMILATGNILGIAEIDWALYGRHRDDRLGIRRSEGEMFAGKSFAEAKREWIRNFERSFLEQLLRETAGNVAAAARQAVMHKKNLIDKLRRLDITADRFRLNAHPNHLSR